MLRAILKRGEEDRVLAGHPWIFDNEIEGLLWPNGDKAEEPPAGEIVDIEAQGKRYLGRGFYNGNSKIRVRVFSRSKEGADKGFFKRRLREAIELRALVRDIERDSARLAFAEADLLPGLIVDQFVDHGLPSAPLERPKRYLSAQFLSAGMDLRKEAILAALDELLSPAAVVERDDVPVRELEGLPQCAKLLSGELPEKLVIRENGIAIEVSLLEGQKTGYFLDQKENRAAIKPFCPDARVLDCFSHSGGFALHAASYGAREVIALDISENATQAIARNAELNGFGDRVKTVTANAFDYLREKPSELFDLVILDPPAFAKSRSQIEAARRGYKEINLRGIDMLKAGGVLVTFSCSYHMHRDEFESMLAEAALDSGRRLRILESRGQAPDHPALAGYPESAYLKCVIAQLR